RYVPYSNQRKPQELLTIANAILGQGQLSLAKYLFIAAKEDNPELDIHDIPAFFQHMLERVDWRKDLHFQTRTTIDTLDYSGTGFNEGSKLVIAAAGSVRRRIPTKVPVAVKLPDGFHSPRICIPGVLAVQGPSARDCRNVDEIESEMTRFVASCLPTDEINAAPMVVIVDDSEFTAQSLKTFFWVAFTRSDPPADLSR